MNEEAIRASLAGLVDDGGRPLLAAGEVAEIAIKGGWGSNAHLTPFVLYELACLHNPEFFSGHCRSLVCILGQSGRQRRGTGRR